MAAPASGPDSLKTTQALGNWRSGRGALWQRLADAIDLAVERGELTPGERLPAERVLADQLAVGRSTVVRALGALADRGIVTRSHGSGTYIAAPRRREDRTRKTGPWPLSEYYRPGDQVPGGLGAAVIPSTEGLPEELLQLTAADFEQLGAARSGYALAGLPSTRHCIARALQDAGIPAAAENILVTSGATQALALLLGQLIRPDDAVIVDRQAYPGALGLLRRAGARIIAAPATPAGHTDVAAMHRYAMQHSAAAVVIMTDGNAATGAAIPDSDRHLLADLAARGVAVVDDRTLADYRDPGSVTPLAREGIDRNIFTIGSLNKIYWGGLRLGWACVSEAVMPALVRAKSSHDSGASVPSQLIAEKLLSRHGEIAASRRRAVAETRAVAEAALADMLPGWRSEGAPFGPALWVKVPGMDAAPFVEHAFTAGTPVSYGGDFRADGRPSRHVRLSLTNGPAKTRDLIGSLAAVWRDYVNSIDPA